MKGRITKGRKMVEEIWTEYKKKLQVAIIHWKAVIKIVSKLKTAMYPSQKTFNALLVSCP
jgi:hypothetical protein